MDHDKWVDVDAARALVDEVGKGELFLCPGAGHLFTDPDLPDHDEIAAALVRRRTLDFLARVR
jgi:hypothetical protein